MRHLAAVGIESPTRATEIPRSNRAPRGRGGGTCHARKAKAPAKGGDMGNSRGLEFDPRGLRTEAAKPPSVHRIAVADDTPQDLEVLQEILRAPNIEIFPATGSEELFRVLGKHRPLDLVVTDID